MNFVVTADKMTNRSVSLACIRTYITPKTVLRASYALAVFFAQVLFENIFVLELNMIWYYAIHHK